MSCHIISIVPASLRFASWLCFPCHGLITSHPLYTIRFTTLEHHRNHMAVYLKLSYGVCIGMPMEIARARIAPSIDELEIIFQERETRDCSG